MARNARARTRFLAMILELLDGLSAEELEAVLVTLQSSIPALREVILQQHADEYRKSLRVLKQTEDADGADMS